VRSSAFHHYCHPQQRQKQQQQSLLQLPRSKHVWSSSHHLQVLCIHCRPISKVFFPRNVHQNRNSATKKSI
jgi:hypothetical protein